MVDRILKTRGDQFIKDEDIEMLKGRRQQLQEWKLNERQLGESVQWIQGAPSCFAHNREIFHPGPRGWWWFTFILHTILPRRLDRWTPTKDVRKFAVPLPWYENIGEKEGSGASWSLLRREEKKVGRWYKFNFRIIMFDFQRFCKFTANFTEDNLLIIRRGRDWKMGRMWVKNENGKFFK